nr:unnamed protein product [Digitaria exilis]
MSQLINHGVPDEVIQDVKRDIAEFFKLPLEAKKEHAKPPDGLEGYGQVFVFSDTQKLDWSDMLYLMLRPVESREMRFWPAAKVVSCLLRFMAEDMGVEPERLLEMFGGQPQTMKVTYYPPCRQASDVLGLSPHTDACAMTLLLHVNDVQGLQIRRDDGRWLAVEPLDGALIVSILSNGKYKSVEHRAVVHPDKERISAAMFHQPRYSITVEPLPELVKKDGAGARYKSVGYAEFMRHFFSAKLDGRKSHLDHFRID